LMTLAFKKWSTVWMQTETKKIPTITSQTVSLNEALLSLSIYFSSLILSYSFIWYLSFHIKDVIWTYLFFMRGPSYTGLEAMMIPEPHFPLIIYFFLLLYYKDKEILQKDILIQNGLFLSMLIHLSCNKWKVVDNQYISKNMIQRQYKMQ
jgi:hypothetical protein